MESLVSVLMPCYNSAHTLPLALASLVVQDYREWECIVVDDGSIDDPERVVRCFGDSRIKYYRFEQNRGRATARQYSLDRSSGEYLCMLDADDWWYPNKLSAQLRVMRDEPQICLVASAIGSVDTEGRLCGVRGASDSVIVRCGPFDRLRKPPVPWGTCMLRTSLARAVHFDPRFLFSEDSDFLVQLMRDRYYSVIPNITYIYSEYETITASKVEASLKFDALMFAKHQDRYPLASRCQWVASTMKRYMYRVVFALGIERLVIQSHSRKPTASEIEEYRINAENVEGVARAVIERAGLSDEIRCNAFSGRSVAPEANLGSWRDAG